MSLHLFRAGVALAALALFLAATPLSMAQTQRDLSVEQNQAFVAGQPNQSSLSILALLDRADATYGAGETVRLAVKANEDAYVTVFNIGPTGNITQLFPNASQPDALVKAGETYEIPAAGSGAQLKVTGPVGAELIKIVATSKPIAIVPPTRLQTGPGIFRSLDRTVEDFVRDLQVVATTPPATAKVAIVNQVIKTVPARGPQAVSNTLVVPAPAPGVIPVTSGVGQTFPLLLATDRPSYRVGEKMTIAVTALQPCHLSVYSFDQTGRGRLLFPSIMMPGNALSGQQTVMISGGMSPQSVVALQAGQETLTALCTAEPRPLAVAVKSAADLLSAEEKAAVDRDLALVPSRPAGTTGYAQAAVAVTP